MFESGQVLERVQEMGDLFEPVLTLKQKLPKLAGIGETEAQVGEGLELAAQAEDSKKARKSAKPGGRSASSKKKGRRV